MTEPLDLDSIEQRAHSRQETFGTMIGYVVDLIAEIRRLRELLDDRTGDIADKALENASLRSQLTAIRSWAETTSNGSAAAAVATLMDDPPRINYCGYCGFSHASCRC